jgi:hypothetical protein
VLTTVSDGPARRTRDHLAYALAYAHPLPGAYDLDDPWLPTYFDWLESFDRCTSGGGTRNDPNDDRMPGDMCLHGELVDDGHGNDPRWVVWQEHVGDDDTREAAVLFPSPCLFRDLAHWDLATGQMPPATYAWIDDPEFVELDVATLDGAPADWAHDVQVELGGHRLALVAIASTPRGVRLRFETVGARLPRGLQIAFFAFGPDRDLDQPKTRFAVYAIRWRT